MLPNSNEIVGVNNCWPLQTVLGTFVDSSPSPVKFWFHTDKIVSTEWRDLVPRQRICDCSGISLPSLRTFLIRCYQVTKLLCSRNRSFITSSARNPRSFSPQPHVAISVFGGSEYKYCASVFVAPLLHPLPDLSSLFQRDVRAHASPGHPENFRIGGGPSLEQSGLSFRVPSFLISFHSSSAAAFRVWSLHCFG